MDDSQRIKVSLLETSLLEQCLPRMSSLRTSGLALVVIFVTTSLGCGHLYNTGKAAAAAKISEQYKTADVVGLIETERANLDALLAEELATVRENQKIQNDFAILSIADDDTPMAETLTEEAHDRIGQLGFGDVSKLLDGLERRIDSKKHEEDLQLSKNQIKLLNQSDGSELPDCLPGVELPNSIEVESEDNRELIELEYETFKTHCAEMLSAMAAEKGAILTARLEWTEARKQLEARTNVLAQAQNALTNARSSYRSALEAALKEEKKGKDLETALEGAKTGLGTALDAADAVGLGGGERVESILTILAATAGGEVNENADPGVKAAAIVAERIPSLAGDIARLRAENRAPNVSNLLIEMQHQVVMLDYQKKMRDLDEREVDLIEAKYLALVEEAVQWLKFSNAMCSFAVLNNEPEGKHPEEECLEFKASISQTGHASCQLGGTPIPNCALDKPWNEALEKTSRSRPKRELYKALTSYLQALSQQSIPAEQNFRRIDLLHRRTLAARESSIRSWDNVVAVPIGQVDAYFQSGLKPEEIADLIVKALGFTAVGVGLAL